MSHTYTYQANICTRRFDSFFFYTPIILQHSDKESPLSALPRPVARYCCRDTPDSAPAPFPLPLGPSLRPRHLKAERKTTYSARFNNQQCWEQHTKERAALITYHHMQESERGVCVARHLPAAGSGPRYIGGVVPTRSLSCLSK